ncbi:DUF72 domain-containing protein [Spirosoma linguale]|uniref:DUF72 domain-containing protein n=1 Tax=Spirosoma linguale (strain ATCC 33905 / DSM 74 / LMG 10896 / Claus 1) TaxID=504472 RepID=D2QKG2_SPILD|nr:protein of unknown function DUF72 [Spirosoma linguale DSM 74]
MSEVLQIGTCGFGVPKDVYAQQFSSVEVQHTFYQPPQLATLARWRDQVPTDFEFTLKAWQLITHSAQSPTYKRIKKPLTDAERAEAGFFRPTPTVEHAWQVTRQCAQALRARTVLFQCPASFTQTPQHIAQLTRFFSDIDRSGLTFAWEPRGPWDKDTIKGLCEDLQLWHVVDPFVQATTTPDHCYFRLHGRQGWRYTYDMQELTELAELVPDDQRAYVFFNNSQMRQDALVFKGLL